MNTGLFDKNGNPIHVGSRTRLVLDDGEVREFDVCFKTVHRTTVKTFEGFEPETTDVAITGIFFCWEGNDLLPCVDEKGASDVSKMEVIEEPGKGMWLAGDDGLQPCKWRRKMNRELLFRAKHIHISPKNEHLDGEWIEGYLYDKNYINSPELEGEFLIDKSSVCQYTGLNDMNGRKIFEGDIVKTSQYGVDDGNGHNYAGFDKFSIEFFNGSFWLKNNLRIFSFRSHVRYEIIGNIFDNPELLER